MKKVKKSRDTIPVSLKRIEESKKNNHPHAPTQLALGCGTCSSAETTNKVAWLQQKLMLANTLQNYPRWAMAMVP